MSTPFRLRLLGHKEGQSFVDGPGDLGRAAGIARLGGYVVHAAVGHVVFVHGPVEIEPGVDASVLVVLYALEGVQGGREIGRVGFLVIQVRVAVFVGPVRGESEGVDEVRQFDLGPVVPGGIHEGVFGRGVRFHPRADLDPSLRLGVVHEGVRRHVDEPFGFAVSGGVRAQVRLDVLEVPFHQVRSVRRGVRGFEIFAHRGGLYDITDVVV